MRNITISVSDYTYRQMRVWCARRDTCITQVVRAFLDDLPRLKQVTRFPLPQAPHQQSIGALFDSLYGEDLDMIREQLELTQKK